MLNDSQLRSAKKKDKAYRLTDAKGLFLSIEPSGSKIWRVRYKIKGKESQVTIGYYPEMSLADARIALIEVKKVRVKVAIPLLINYSKKGLQLHNIRLR